MDDEHYKNTYSTTAENSDISAFKDNLFTQIELKFKELR